MLFTAAFWAKTFWVLPLIALGAYLLGSFNTALIVSRLWFKADIRTAGSGNAGFTNVLRTYGKWPAIVTAAGDLCKSLLAVLLGGLVLISAAQTCIDGRPELEMEARLIGQYLAGLFCVLGHLFPLYFGLRGGKGVMTTLGMMLILDWRVALLALSVFFIVLYISKMVSLGSICAAGILPVLTGLFRGLVDRVTTEALLFCTLMALLIGLILIVKHRSNISRILHGTENKITKKG